MLINITYFLRQHLICLVLVKTSDGISYACSLSVIPTYHTLMLPCDKGNKDILLYYTFGVAHVYDLAGCIAIYEHQRSLNSLRPRQNGLHFADNTFKWFVQNQNVWISIKISLICVPRAPINNIQSLVQIMAWRQWWLIYWRIYASLGLDELNGRLNVCNWKELSPLDINRFALYHHTDNAFSSTDLCLFPFLMPSYTRNVVFWSLILDHSMQYHFVYICGLLCRVYLISICGNRYADIA